MRYEVICFFTDLQDNSHPYKVGETFPRQGMDVSAARIEELMSSKNKRRRQLIKAVPDEPEQESESAQPEAETKKEQQEPESAEQEQQQAESETQAETQKEQQQNEVATVYTERKLSAMNKDTIMALATERGYSITADATKAKMISEFLQQQG